MAVSTYARNRYGMLACISLIAIYYASIRWCLRSKAMNGESSPIVIHIDGLLEPYLVGQQRPRPIQNAIRQSILDNFINGSMLDARDIKLHQNEDILFFNRIPKTGSEMIVLLLQWLQSQNEFRHYRLKNTLRRYLTTEEQLDVAAELGEIVQSSEQRYISFDKHLHFTNFTQIGLKMPILINIVRDPVEKVTSGFYYARVTPRPGGFTPKNFTALSRRPFLSLEECVLAKAKECTFLNGLEYDLTIPYFCGHKRYCRQLNNMAALLTAKRNAEQWYTAVGVLEDLNSTMAVLESRIPKFFKGVTQLYFEELHALHANKNWQKPQMEPDWVINQIRRNLGLEYEFYEFIKQKLSRDFSIIT